MSYETSTIDPYKILQIVPNADGTITREYYSRFPSTIATPNPDDHQETIVLSKDVPINQVNNTWVRIFVPHHNRQDLDSSSSSTKLPLIVYFHGGGFIILSAATKIFHDTCSTIAAKIPCIVVSVEYRLAPEHRLPAAYDDAMEALHWIKNTQEEWLQKYADFSNCFLMGDSAGGAIAYHAGLCASAQVDNLFPLKIRGIILNYPFFGGVKRTDSELRSANYPDFPLSLLDLMWELSLPIGVDRDHEFCNPTVGGGSKGLDQIKILGWKVLMIAGKRDPLIDRQIELLKLMEKKGVNVASYFGKGGHGGDFEDYNAVQASIKNFILSSGMGIM